MVITTCNKYDSNVKLSGTNLLDSSKADTIKEYQTVVAVGSNVRGIEPGDTVFINPNRYMIRKHQEGSLKDGVITDNPVVGYKFEIVDIEGVPHLCLYDNDIKYVAEVEEFEENPTIITENKKLIV